VERPVGETVPEWRPARRPDRTALRGSFVTLRTVDPEADAGPLYDASRDPAIWTYLFDGPFATLKDFRRSLEAAAPLEDPFRYTIVREGRPQGMASYARVKPEHGVIELANIWFGTSMRRTAGATEAIFLLARNAFDALGYRRVEWKCDSLNAGSRRAAERFGFRFEGVFEAHMVVKGRNRDTAWYAITDRRWPEIRSAFEAWLAPENFDDEGRQRQRLQQLRVALGR
jgi:RimJ/RimL family protein N-acetyltransferase